MGYITNIEVTKSVFKDDILNEVTALMQYKLVWKFTRQKAPYQYAGLGRTVKEWKDMYGKAICNIAK